MHESSDSHIEAVARYVTAPATVIGDIGDLLFERHALEKRNNRLQLTLSATDKTLDELHLINFDLLTNNMHRMLRDIII